MKKKPLRNMRNDFSRRDFLRAWGMGILGVPLCLEGIGVETVSARPMSSLDEELFIASDFTPPGGFTSGVEGPACDEDGNLYAVNYRKQGTIGKVTPTGEAEVFLELPPGSTGNGIRFDSRGDMLIADYTGHNVLRVDMETREITVWVHEPTMNQPNDLAITSSDIVFASDPDWKGNTGNIWRITPDGVPAKLETLPGTTNGIEISPDDSILYVNTSNNRSIWAFDLSPDGEISNKRLFVRLPDHHTDGMRCDIDGNLYATWIGKGMVVKVSPGGEILKEIALTGLNPSNIAFGGGDGRTCYVTMADRRNIETFRADRPGRNWRLYQDRKQLAVSGGNATAPLVIELAGNFPNPFNSSTSIEYVLHETSYVELSIYGTNGQKVAVLQRGVVRAGRHTVPWNASDASSGVYICRLQAGGTVETTRMTLLK